MTGFEITWVVKGYEASNSEVVVAKNIIEAIVIFQVGLRQRYDVEAVILAVRMVQ